MSASDDPVNEDAIAVLARAGDLPIQQGRAAIVAKPLAAWLRDANELNRKMSQAKYLDIIPATMFYQR